MSYAAVHEVTRALRKLLLSQLTLVGPNPVVTLLPPGTDLPKTLGVNLYLYRVVESPFTKNQSWRGDRVTPPAPQPALGLQLFFLLTPLGTQPDPSSEGDDAHTMLGVAMSTLHENAILNDVHIPGFDADIELADFLRNSFEQIKISLVPTNLDELSKIWATINQPYRLSVAYEVSLVEITPTPPPPVTGAIVLSTGVSVITLDPPRLTQLVPASGALVGVDGGGTLQANELEIQGFGLGFPGQLPVVGVGGRPVALKNPPTPPFQSLTVILPTNLDAGPQADVTVTVNSRASTPLTFTVAPWLANVKPIRTDLPTAPADRKLTLTGNGFTATPPTIRFDGPGGTTNVSADTGNDTGATATIPTTLANGVYNVRVVRSDQQSSNSRTLEVLPRVDRPIGVTVVTVGSRNVHRLTLNGERLNGKDLRLLLDGVTYQVAPDPADPNIGTNPNQVVYTLGRLLDAGTHQVALSVDGHMSRTIDLEV